MDHTDQPSAGSASPGTQGPSHGRRWRSVWLPVRRKLTPANGPALRPVEERGPDHPGEHEQASAGDAPSGAWGQAARDVSAPGARDDLTDAPDAPHSARGQVAADALTLAVFAHEARSPLAVAKGAVETLQRLGTTAAETQEQLLEMSIRGLSQLEALIAHLLEGFGSGDVFVAASTTAIALSLLVRRAVAACADRDRVTISVSEPDPQVRVHPALLSHAVLLLLDNALKHTDGPVQVSAQAHGRGACIVVEDHGPGIPQDDRERVFEVGWRGVHRAGQALGAPSGGHGGLDGAAGRAPGGHRDPAESAHGPGGARDIYEVSRSADTGDPGGLGIGLALVDRIARLHGGVACVADAPAGGARFVIELPDLDAVPAG
jgi:two-component system, OmpR family, sensor histidine kinase MtrB